LVGRLFFKNGVIPLDVLTEIYVCKDLWDKIIQMDENGELRIDTIRILDCELSVKMMSDDSGRYVLQLMNK